MFRLAYLFGTAKVEAFVNGGSAALANIGTSCYALAKAGTIAAAYTNVVLACSFALKVSICHHTHSLPEKSEPVSSAQLTLRI